MKRLRGIGYAKSSRRRNLKRPRNETGIHRADFAPCSR
jgi:hypothetical protein